MAKEAIAEGEEGVLFQTSEDQSESESVSHSVMSDSLQPHGL